jgi:hypothetical protein
MLTPIHSMASATLVLRLERIDMLHRPSPLLLPELRETPYALVALRVTCHPKPVGHRMAETEGFEPSIELYNPITV